jgi:regulator of protease activity HflC (stomatin/prohibitin superfamily)
MTEPIKLPNMPFDLYHSIQDCDQYNAIRKYTTDAVEQATAELRAEVERLRASEGEMLREVLVSSLPTIGMGWIDRANKAEAEVERLRADAERYRWLRARYRAMSMDMGGNHSWVPDGRVMRELRGPTLNAAIDAALKEAK